MDHAVLVLVAQLILFIATLVGALAIGRRFIDKEYPGFVQRVEAGMTTLKLELLSEIEGLRSDVMGMREQLITHRVTAAEQAERVAGLQRRVTKLEDRVENGMPPPPPRRRRDDGERG
jgi:hypothetical protein